MSDVTELFPVESVPTSVLVRNGAVLATLEGANAVELTNLVTTHARTAAAATAVAATPASSAAAPAAAASAAADGAAAAAAAPSPAAESKESLHARLSTLVSAAPVMAFIKGTPAAPRCGFTKQLLALFEAEGVQYSSFDILSDQAVREGLKSFSNWPTYPQVYVSGQLVGGLDIIKELAASGELASTIPAGHIKPKVDPKAALETRLRALISQARVMLFMKGSPADPKCGFSKKAVALLADLGLAAEGAGAFGSFDIFSDMEVREGLKTLSNWPTYPQLYIDGELVGGLDVMQEMMSNGELQAMIDAPPPLEAQQQKQAQQQSNEAQAK